MKNKILIPLLIGGVLAAFFSFKYIGGADENPGEHKKQLVLQTIMRTIKEGHFAPKAVDDTFSARAFRKLMENLDYEKKFFTRQDVSEMSVYQYRLDDEIQAGSVAFFDHINAIFSKSIDRAEGYYKEILKTPFTFTSNEQIQLNGDKIAYAADENALRDRWRLYLKYRVLAKYVDLKNAQDKDSTADKKVKTDIQLEEEARESVLKNQNNFFKRLRKINDNDRFAIFVNSITTSEDPHTDFFPPKDKQRFDEAMSGTFFGIGAQLREEEGKIKIVSIITGSPAWKQGELKAGDEITKVAQGTAEPVDVQGFEIDDVVQIIRGKKGTEVRLTVKKLNGAVKVIPIVRDEVLIEEVFAKSAIIQGASGPVGYIYLPEFYADFRQINGRRSGEDVAKEVIKLKNAGVTGIILDLRHNGGGSLSDVVDMAGLFIDKGPIVQVKSSDAAPMTLSDDAPGMLYDGPLAIMINEGSASASEIMAAAMQDYRRAIIVGAPTFGKGTVQKIVSLDEFVDPITRMRLQSRGDGQIGSLKITVQKFYRINGGSTQLKGVTPDVVLPTSYALIDMGERRDKAALPWDEIPAARYQPMGNAAVINNLVAMSRKRVASNPIFNLIEENAKKLKAQEQDNTYSLNEQAYRKELEEANANSEKMEKLQKQGTPLVLTNPKEDMSRIRMDSSSVAKNEQWLKGLQKDIYLAETVNIINDMARSNMRFSMGSTIRKN